MKFFCWGKWPSISDNPPSVLELNFPTFFSHFNPIFNIVFHWQIQMLFKMKNFLLAQTVQFKKIHSEMNLNEPMQPMAIIRNKLELTYWNWLFLPNWFPLSMCFVCWWTKEIELAGLRSKSYKWRMENRKNPIREISPFNLYFGLIFTFLDWLSFHHYHQILCFILLLHFVNNTWTFHLNSHLKVLPD